MNEQHSTPDNVSPAVDTQENPLPTQQSKRPIVALTAVVLVVAGLGVLAVHNYLRAIEKTERLTAEHAAYEEQIQRQLEDSVASDSKQPLVVDEVAHVELPMQSSDLRGGSKSQHLVYTPIEDAERGYVIESLEVHPSQGLSPATGVSLVVARDLSHVYLWSFLLTGPGGSYVYDGNPRLLIADSVLYTKSGTSLMALSASSGELIEQIELPEGFGAGQVSIQDIAGPIDQSLYVLVSSNSGTTVAIYNLAEKSWNNGVAIETPMNRLYASEHVLYGFYTGGCPFDGMDTADVYRLDKDTGEPQEFVSLLYCADQLQLRNDELYVVPRGSVHELVLSNLDWLAYSKESVWLEKNKIAQELSAM